MKNHIIAILLVMTGFFVKKLYIDDPRLDAFFNGYEYNISGFLYSCHEEAKAVQREKNGKFELFLMCKEHLDMLILRSKEKIPTKQLDRLNIAVMTVDAESISFAKATDEHPLKDKK